MNTINFTPGKLTKLRKEYLEAVQKGDEQFTFEGNVLLVCYAKYLIEYLEMQFNPPKKRKVRVT